MSNQQPSEITSKLPHAILNSASWIIIGYIVIITLAELLVTFADPRLGLLLHAILLGAFVLHIVFIWNSSLHRLILPLLFVPLIRLLSLSLPLAGIDRIYWYLIISLPLFIISPMIIRLLGLTWQQVGFVISKPKLQLVAMLSGIVFGFIEYSILRPEPFIEDLSLSKVIVPSLILLFNTGLFEELIFRGIIQQAAEEVLGKWKALLFSALIFTILHIGYKSIVDLLFVFCAGLSWGYLFIQTRSIIGITIGHGITNIILFIVAPLIFLSPNQSNPTNILSNLQVAANETSESATVFEDNLDQLLDYEITDKKIDSQVSLLAGWILVILFVFLSFGGYGILALLSNHTNKNIADQNDSHTRMRTVTYRIVDR